MNTTSTTSTTQFYRPNSRCGCTSPSSANSVGNGAADCARARQAKLLVADLERILEQRTQLLNQRTRELRSAHLTLGQEIAQRSQAQARLAALSTLGRRLNGARTVAEACQIIVDTAQPLFRWNVCQVDRYAPDTQTLTRLLSADCIGVRRKENGGDEVHRSPSALECKAMEEGGQLIVEQGPVEFWPEQTPRKPVSILCVPIRDGQGVTGLLTMQSCHANAYDQSSLEVLQALADQCGGAWDRISPRQQSDPAAAYAEGILSETEANLEPADQQLVQA